MGSHAELRENSGLQLIAYQTHPWTPMKLVPAPSRREWMSATRGFAIRCLPLLIANEAGWLILNSHCVRATWHGGNEPASLEIEYLRGWAPYSANSHFGYGILTWTVPYLFRTPSGYNLLVRGPANWPKDGIYPLEGIVETDWSVATFTVNWKFTRPGATVIFEQDEPICMLVPQKRGELETFHPTIRDIATALELARAHQHWSDDRQRFLFHLAAPGSEKADGDWQKHYFVGVTPEGFRAREHQTKLRLRPFSVGSRNSE